MGMVVVLQGLSGLGKPLSDEFVHRPEQFAALSGLEIGEPVTAAGLLRVLTHAQGGLKGMPAPPRRVVLLNQADDADLQAQAKSMVPALLHHYQTVIIASLGAGMLHAVYEPVAGVVLAAGGSTRLGRPKPLLDWRGQPFVRAVAQTAVSAGLEPVVVVTGAEAGDVEQALAGLPVQVVHNEAWESGQASSIRAGLRALPAGTGAAVFLLADQPQVGADVIAALVDRHATQLDPIVAPLVMLEKRGNPVLFDCVTFQDLMALEGDVGGRAVFSRHHVEYLPWYDERLLLDVDTEQDYRRLLEEDRS
jgi:molybdenum cofactor cytidylyltransferase